MALCVYDLSGRKEKYLAESLEPGYALTIRETSTRSIGSRQHCKLQTMLIGNTDNVDGLIPGTAYELCVPKPKRPLRLDRPGDLRKVSGHFPLPERRRALVTWSPDHAVSRGLAPYPPPQDHRQRKRVRGERP